MRRFAGLLGIATTSLVAISSCSSSDSSQNASGGDAGAPIVIGVSLPLTGDLGSIGQPLQNATRVAESQINSLGGVLGRKLQYRIVDDTTDTGSVVTGVVRDFLSGGVSGLIGPCGSGQATAVQGLAYAAHVVQISASATSTLLTTAQPLHDRYFFRTTPADDFQGKAVAVLASQGVTMGADGGIAAGCSKMAVVHADDDYGNPMASVIAAAFGALGGSVDLDVKIPTDVKQSYSTEVSAVLAAKPDCQAIIVYDPAGDQYLRDFKAALAAAPGALSATFFTIGTDGIYVPSFIINGRLNKTDPNSSNVVEGTFGTNPDTMPPTPEYSDFRSLYATQFPLAAGTNDPDPYTANQYDAAILIALAIEQAQTSTDGAKIRDALYAVSKGGKSFGPSNVAAAFQAIHNGVDIDYKGASGDVDLGDDGNVSGDYIVWTVQNGEFVTLRRLKASDLL